MKNLDKELLMDVKNENRFGYKKTKVGWIPEKWYYRQLEEVSLNHNAGIYKKQEEYGNGSNIVGVSNLYDIHEIDGQFFQRVPLTAIELAKHSLDEGDLLYGESSLVREGIARTLHVTVRGVGTAFAWHTRRYKLNKKILNPVFLFYYLQSLPARRFMMSVSTQTALTGITTKDYFQCPIPIASLSEQEAIAGVLKCWDKAIRNYEKKIEKKRNVKKGLMQRLLTGKQRLPGFAGEWKEIVFGEVFEFLKTYPFSREQLTLESQESVGIYNIHYGDIHATYTGYVLDFEKERAVPLIKKAKEIPLNPILLREGDLIIADASEDYEGVGACVELRNIGSRKVTSGLHTFVARDKGDHSVLGFRSFLLKCPAFARRMKKISTGVSVHGISKGNLSREKIFLPPLPEQQAIASVVSAADSEIEAMERKLAILKDQKKFLLNNLVTGTIRLSQFRSGTINADADGDHT